MTLLKTIVTRKCKTLQYDIDAFIPNNIGGNRYYKVKKVYFPVANGDDWAWNIEMEVDSSVTMPDVIPKNSPNFKYIAKGDEAARIITTDVSYPKVDGTIEKKSDTQKFRDAVIDPSGFFEEMKMNLENEEMGRKIVAIVSDFIGLRYEKKLK